MNKVKDMLTRVHTIIKHLNFILLKRKLLSYFSMFTIFVLALFFLVYMPYINNISEIKVVDSSLYQLSSSIIQLHKLQEETNKRDETLKNILLEFKKNNIDYSIKDRFISFNTGYLKYETLMKILFDIEKTGFLRIINLSITNVTGKEKNIMSPNKYIYLKKLIIYSTAKVNNG